MGADATAVALALLGVLGLLIGSFLNVVIHRVPAGESLVRPRSRCPQCQTPITPRDNIPVVSWLLLHGRCRHCQAPIAIRYPIVEISTGAVWVVLGAWALGEQGQAALLPLLLVLGSAGVALFVIDLDHHRLPDAIVLPLYPVTVVGLALAGLLTGDWPLMSAGVGLLIWLAVIGGLWLVSGGRGMGFGDVKMAPVLGVTLGWISVSVAVVGLFTAFAMGAVVGIVLMLARRAGRRSALAFGPFLLAGSLVAILVGGSVADAYLGLLSGP